MGGCGLDPEHPSGADAVPVLAGPVVARVGDRAVTAAEAAEFAATRQEPSSADLVERERKVIAALEMGLDPELPRKRAMVRALLADEVEAKVGVADVDPKVLAEERQRALDDLREFSGYEAVSIRVASLELHRNRGTLSPERVAELQDKVRSAARALLDAVPETDAIEAAESLDLSGVDPELTVERKTRVKVIDIGESRQPPKGWVRAQVLASKLGTLQDGERTPLIEAGSVPLFAVRRGRIDASPVDEAKVSALAEERAITRARRARLEAMLSELRRATPLVVHPELLEEAQ